MNAPRYARIAARLFAQEPVGRTELNGEKRAQAIAAIERALVAKKRRQTRRIWAWGVSAAAAAALASYGAWHTRSRPVAAASPPAILAVVQPNGSGTAIVNGAGAEPLVGAASLAQGGHLVAGSGGGATVRLSTGTELSVEHDTNVEFESAGPIEKFYLTQGLLHAKVAKLGHGERFIVRTPDAEVEVRGTVFQVAIVDADVNCGDGTRTRVSVSEGIVEVRGNGATHSIHPGEIWPAGCPSAPVASVTHEALPATRRAPMAVQAERAPSTPTTPAAPEAISNDPLSARQTSSIAEQNALFAEASAAHRRGDDVSAVNTYATLIARYPASPLAESAAVQRMNLLQGSERAAAARQYLARYPRGYARNDAERLLAQP